jgi:hypothetical protein
MPHSEMVYLGVILTASRDSCASNRPASQSDECCVDQPVEDAVGQRRIVYLFIPARDCEFRGQDRRVHPIAIFADLPKVATLQFPSLGLACCGHRL